MTRNNRYLLISIAGFACLLGAIKGWQSGRSLSSEEPIVLYLPLPHPYCNAVAAGGQAYGEEGGAGVRILFGQESTQANVNTNIESMYTLGYQGFAVYPVDPAGSKGLFQRLVDGGRHVVAYGAEPADGSAAPFAVATHTREAATLAAETLIRLMGERGNILNVLESATDANTPLRKAAVEAVVARYPNVQIIQTIGDVTMEQKALEKIESALVARGAEVDGVICTGYTTTVAGAVLLSKMNQRPGAKRIHFVGLDTDERVLEAIRNGSIDATLAQNPFGHGYISCALLDLLLGGWTPREPYQFIDSGSVVVTRENVDTFGEGIREVTGQIVEDMKTRYLLPPGTN